MALQHDRVVELGDACRQLAERTQELLADVEKFLDQNSHLSIDWGAGQTPAYINEEVNGNLSGRTYSRQQVANAIFSLLQVVNVLNNQSVNQGDHLGNLNQLAIA